MDPLFSFVNEAQIQQQVNGAGGGGVASTDGVMVTTTTSTSGSHPGHYTISFPTAVTTAAGGDFVSHQQTYENPGGVMESQQVAQISIPATTTTPSTMQQPMYRVVTGKSEDNQQIYVIKLENILQDDNLASNGNVNVKMEPAYENPAGENGTSEEVVNGVRVKVEEGVEEGSDDDVKNEDDGPDPFLVIDPEAVMAMATSVGVDLNEDDASYLGCMAANHVRHAALVALQFSQKENSAGVTAAHFARAEEELGSPNLGHQSAFREASFKYGGGVSLLDDGPELDLYAAIAYSENGSKDARERDFLIDNEESVLRVHHLLNYEKTTINVNENNDFLNIEETYDEPVVTFATSIEDLSEEEKVDSDSEENEYSEQTRSEEEPLTDSSEPCPSVCGSSGCYEEPEYQFQAEMELQDSQEQNHDIGQEHLQEEQEQLNLQEGPQQEEPLTDSIERYEEPAQNPFQAEMEVQDSQHQVDEEDQEFLLHSEESLPMADSSEHCPSVYGSSSSVGCCSSRSYSGISENEEKEDEEEDGETSLDEVADEVLAEENFENNSPCENNESVYTNNEEQVTESESMTVVPEWSQYLQVLFEEVISHESDIESDYKVNSNLRRILKDLRQNGAYPVFHVICDTLRDYVREDNLSLNALFNILAVVDTFVSGDCEYSLAQITDLGFLLVEILILPPSCELHKVLSSLFVKVMKVCNELLTWTCTYVTKMLNGLSDVPVEDFLDPIKSTLHGTLCLMNGLEEDMKIQIAREFDWHTSILSFSRNHSSMFDGQSYCMTKEDFYLAEESFKFYRNLLNNYTEQISPEELSKIRETVAPFYGGQFVMYLPPPLASQTSFINTNSEHAAGNLTTNSTTICMDNGVNLINVNDNYPPPAKMIKLS